MPCLQARVGPVILRSGGRARGRLVSPGRPRRSQARRLVSMSAGATGYLVVRREDGFGDVFPLAPGQSYTLGRATTNRIVLKDDLCSREHAEVSDRAGRWRVRDLNSL